MIKVVFFARLREQLGVAEQQVESQRDETIAALAERLVLAGGDGWEVLLSVDTVCAQNQQIVDRDSVVSEGDEIAFFPPVTGG